MSAGLIEVQQCADSGLGEGYQEWSAEIEESLDQGDIDSLAYGEANPRLFPHPLDFETLAQLHREQRSEAEVSGDPLEPINLDWGGRCQVDGCEGRVQYENGLGACETCGTDHMIITPANYSKLFPIEPAPSEETRSRVEAVKESS